MTSASDPAAAVVPRVAVVAVHGIADQRPGETGQAVAAQLAAACQGQVLAHELLLTVPPLDPALPFRRWEPAAWVHRAWKSLRQWWRSDFLDPSQTPAAPLGQKESQVSVPTLRRWLDAAQPCLLTMGSPLRQLYALRFPALYAWPVNDIQDRSHPGWTGPRPSELGLHHWSNLWASGDYVGRWL